MIEERAVETQMRVSVPGVYAQVAGEWTGGYFSALESAIKTLGVDPKWFLNKWLRGEAKMLSRERGEEWEYDI